jgi:hypothetical protein
MLVKGIILSNCTTSATAAEMKSCCALLVLALAAAVAADTADVTHCLGAAAPVACFQTLAFRLEH